MRLLRLFAVAGALAALAFAPAPFPRKVKAPSDDVKTFQGVWRMTLQESNGAPSKANFKARVRGNRWTFVVLSGNQESDGPAYYFALDQKASPRALEWKSTEHATEGWVGSYRLQGRTLTIVYGRGTLKDLTHRPTSFEDKGSLKMVFEYLGPE
jgi:uncharacterized protein (TIGR03067 family)